MNYCNPEGFKNEIHELLEKGDINAFYHWFDGGETKEGAFEKGDDVFNRVVFPLVEKKMKGKGLVALDLGYGAGTKIEAALEHFDVVYGVDVHGEAKFVADNLLVPEGKKLRLVEGPGDEIPVKSTTIDFVYSWTTFCHLGTIDNVKAYLKEIYRVLKPGGLSVVFFTRLMKSAPNQSWPDVEMDMEREREHTDGYREGGPLSKVRSINLVISMWKMIELAKEAGFTVTKKTASWDQGKRREYHGQYGVVLSKPAPTTTAPPKPKAKKKPVIKRRKK